MVSSWSKSIMIPGQGLTPLQGVHDLVPGVSSSPKSVGGPDSFTLGQPGPEPAGQLDFWNRKENAMEKMKEADPVFAEMLSRRPKLELNKPIDVLNLLKRRQISLSTNDYRSQLNTDRNRVPERLMRDGYVYLFRGDYPGRELRGIFSYVYGRWGTSLDESLAYQERGKDRPLSHFSFQANNFLETEMWQHALGGHGPFIGTTEKFEIAAMHPDFNGVPNNRVYVIKVSKERVFYNYAQTVSGNSEDEFLIPDYVTPDEIVAVINPKDPAFEVFTKTYWDRQIETLRTGAKILMIEHYTIADYLRALT